MHRTATRATRTTGMAIATGLLGLATVAAPAAAQIGQGLTGDAAERRLSAAFPQRQTAIRLMRPVTIQFDNQRLEDVVSFIRDFTQADIDAKWMDDRHPDGLDKDLPISLRADNVTSLRLIEMVLERAEPEFSTGGNTWQFTPAGSLEIGPRERLNRRKRVEIYSIADLLVEVPDYTDAPQFDLNQILQGGGGGGGGSQSPFQQAGNQDDWNMRDKEEKAEDIKMILLELIEPEQWVDNGGDAATIRYWQGNFIVNAPDYIHRQINGYPWWPAAGTRVSMIQGRRYVSLNGSVNFSEIEGFAPQPVSAVVGGRIVRSDDPGGGG